MKPVRVLLADDHTLVRAGIRSLLQSIPDVEVVAEAQDGKQALQLIAEHRPDIVLLDIAMPVLNGLETASRVAKAYPNVRVVMLSMHASEEYVLQALRVGAVGYLLKGASTEELRMAIEAVACGEAYLSPPVSKHLVSAYVSRVSGEAGPLARLTRRQREMLQLVAEGRSNKEIAQLMDIGLKTVETHRTELMKRLDIHDVAGLVRFAIRTGMVPPDA